jgi:hypothetical protein
VLTGSHPERFIAHYDVAELLGYDPTASERALQAGRFGR